MTEAETAVREALAKMTPGEWYVNSYTDDGEPVYQIVSQLPGGDLPGIRHSGEQCVATEAGEKNDAAGIVALKNHTHALLAELDALAAEVERLREVAESLYRRGYTEGAEDAIEAGHTPHRDAQNEGWDNARAALEPRT